MSTLEGYLSLIIVDDGHKCMLTCIKSQALKSIFTLVLGLLWKQNIVFKIEMASDIAFGKKSDKMEYNLEIFENN